MRTLRCAWATSAALLLAAAGCVSATGRVATARDRDDAALVAKPWPEGAHVVVVADGTVAAADDLAAAWGLAPGAAHRYAFVPGSEGDRAYRMAYLPASGTVLGHAFATALGIEIRREADGSPALVRDLRRIAATDGAVTLRVEAPDGSRAATLRVVVDPDFDGPLLVPPDVAAALGLSRFEVPGTADVTVALGRPFFARRAQVRVDLGALGVAGVVPALFRRTD